MSTDKTDQDAAGEKVLAQLRALGMTDEEIVNSAPVDVDPADVMAWLDGRAPCPLPLTDPKDGGA